MVKKNKKNTDNSKTEILNNLDLQEQDEVVSKHSGKVLYVFFIIILLIALFYSFSKLFDLKQRILSVSSSVVMLEKKFALEKDENFSDKFDELDKKVSSLVDKNKLYDDDIALLKNQLKSVQDNQLYYRGPYLVALTMLNQLKQKVDSGEPFMDELRIIRSLKISDINQIVELVSEYESVGIPTLNELQNKYKNSVMKASFDGKNKVPEKPSFIKKLSYKFKGLIKVRKVSVKDYDNSIDAVLSRIETFLMNGDLDNAVYQINILKDLSESAYSSIKDIADLIVLKQKIDSKFSAVFTNLLDNIMKKL